MRRLRRFALTAVILSALATVLAGSVAASPATSIVGTWSGHFGPAGSNAAHRTFTFTVKPGERAGTWQAGAHCGGTLRLKDISSGYYHHYYRLGAKAGCAAPGIDCLKRAGARMVDVFQPKAGGANITGTFRRIS